MSNDLEMRDGTSPDLGESDAGIPCRLVRVVRGGDGQETIVVAKVTFDLRPGVSPVAPMHERLTLEASPYGARSNSLRRIQDIGPMKARADVLVVGSAYAPDGVNASGFEAYVRVAAIDKGIVVRPPSFVEPDGSVTTEPGLHATRLLHELARADESTNPFGMDGVTPDDSGRVPVPQIEAPVDSIGSGEPIGLGPVPLLPDWDLRPIGPGANAALELVWDGDPMSLNAAARDQQLDGPLPDGLTIELVNLHASHPHLATKLETVRLVAYVPGTGSTTLLADTLLIDTDRNVCLVTYRATFGDAHVDTWVEPRVELSRRPRGVELIPQVTAEFDAFDLAEHTMDTPFARTGANYAAALPSLNATGPFPAAPRAPGEDTVELLRRDVAPAAAPPSPVVVPLAPAPPASSPSVPSPPPSVPSFAPVVPAPAPSGSRPRVFDEPTYLARGESNRDAALPPPRPSVPASDGELLARSALQSSNDAAGVEARRIADRASHLKVVPRAVTEPREPPETIELLWAASDLVPKLRLAPSLADAFPENAVADGLGSQALDFTRDVRRALLFARPTLAPQTELAMSAASNLEEDRRSGVYRTPLVLVVGELAASFDARRTLEATIGTIETLLPSDKSLRTLVDAGKKLLDTEWITPPPLDLAAQNLRDAAARLRDPNASAVETTIDRLLLERRAYRTRLVLGGEHLRFTWYDEGRPGVPIYLPNELRDRLPLYARLRARALVELRPRQDTFEPHGVALVLRAIGRRLGAPG